MCKKIAVLLIATSVIACAFGRADQDKSTTFVPIYIQKIKNLTSKNCSLQGLPAAADKTTRFPSKILIPFVSIAKYLREYADQKAYAPEGALSISTPQGRLRLWASEAGVMYAPDPEDTASFDDTWEAEKILGTTARELGAKKEYLATLVLKVCAHKTALALEPAHAS